MGSGETIRVFEKLLDAIRESESHLDFTFEVIVTRKRWFPFPRMAARQAYRHYLRTHPLAKSPHFFIFINVPLKKFLWELTPEVEKIGEQSFWQELLRKFQEDLQSTHFENALCLLVQTIRVAKPPMETRR